MNDTQEKKAIELLQSFAEGVGATRAKRLAPDKVCVEEKLADLCHDPICPFWGQSMSCPPYVTGPAEFRKLLKSCRHTMVISLEIQTCSLQGEDRPQVMRLLHEIVAEIEKKAIQLGFTSSAGFAGGSCKPSFCHDKPNCRVVAKEGECRYPEHARPSMSGYGVNVGKLMESVGWPNTIFTPEDDQEQLSWVAGLILLN